MLPLLCALILAGPPPVVATATRVAIAPIAYSDVIPDHTRAAVRAGLRDTIQKIARDPLILDVDAECETRECSIRQARDAAADVLIELKITLEQRDYAIEIVVLDAAGERQLAEVRELCRLCGQAELLAEIAAQVTTLEPTLERLASGPVPHVDIGPYPFASPMQIGGWVSFSLGVAGVGAGAALIGIDGREHGPTCGVGVRDPAGACPNVYTTKVAGFVVVGLGGAVLATGVGLLIAHAASYRRGFARRIQTAPGGLEFAF